MGSRRTTIVNNTTTSRISTPVQPPSQPTVTSGRIAGVPTVYTIGAVSTLQRSPESVTQSQRYVNPFTAFSSVPYVPFRPVNVFNSVTRVVVPAQTVTNNSLDNAGAIKNEVCDEILGDTLSGVDSFTVCGNGKATRFRFPIAGAPSEIAVTNLSTNALVPGSSYNVLIRGDSVSWLIFDTAPADGVCYNIKYVIGDSPFIRTVRVTNWTGWLVKLNNLQRQLLAAKSNSQTNQSYRFGYIATSSRIPESSAYNGAIDAVIQLKNQIQAPGRKMDLKSIESACNNIEDQLAKIGAGTGKRSQADSTVGGPLITPPAITRGANIVFDFDDRYNSFSPRDGEFYYNGKLYTRQFDGQVGASFFDLNTGRVPPPPVSYQGTNNSGGRDWDEDNRTGTGVTGGNTGVRAIEQGDSAVDVELDDRARTSGGSKSNAPNTSTRPEPRPSTGVKRDPRDASPTSNYGAGRTSNASDFNGRVETGPGGSGGNSNFG